MQFPFAEREGYSGGLRGVGEREAESFVDEVDERFAGEVAAEVFAEEVGHVVERAWRLGRRRGV